MFERKPTDQKGKLGRIEERMPGKGRNVPECRSLIARLTAASALVMAGSTATWSAVLEEITVTAQKREQNMQDVGISVSAFSGDQLDELGFTNTVDIVTQVPSLQLTQFHPSITVFNIRGISQNDFGDQLEAPVAVYVDDAYIGAMGAIHGGLFDMERVEVLRGPQGTLFGRNATGGLVHFISRKPTEELEGYVSLTVAEYDQVKLEGAISGPITSGISGRLSVMTDRHDGILENRVGEDLREADRYSLRGQLSFAIGDAGALDLKLQYSDYDELGNAYDLVNAAPDAQGGLGRAIASDENFWGTCDGCGLTPFVEPDNDGLTGSFDQEGYFEREVTGLNANFSWNFDSFTLTSVSDYLAMDKDYKEDADSSPLTFFEFDTTQEYDQFSQELRLNGDTDDFRWVAGIYYLDMETDNTSGIVIEGAYLGAPAGLIPSGVSYGLESDSWAVFGQVEYDISPAWTVLAGLRYTEDRREIDSTFIDFLNTDGTPIDFNTSTSSLAKQEWENYSAKIELDWRPSENWLTYISVTRGHKAGNFAQPVFATTFKLLPHDEEELTAYEIGFKSDLADGAIRLNASAFYYDYSDYQAFSLQGLEQAIFNKDAELKGAEVELTWVTAIDGLEFLFGASVLEGEAEDIVLPDGTVSNREMPQTPDISVNGLARYSWSGFGGTFSVQADATYNDGSYFSIFNGPEELEESYTLVNANVSYTSGGEHWRLTGFVRNLTDQKYRVYNLDVSAIGIIQNTWAAPRWFGATLDYRF